MDHDNRKSKNVAGMNNIGNEDSDCSGKILN